MTEHPPRIRVRAASGALLIRDSLCIHFYMRHPHAEVAPAVLRALECYRRVVPEDALSSYVEETGDWEPIDQAGWNRIRDELLEPHGAILDLRDATGEKRYRFAYRGRRPATRVTSDTVCAVGFWLPTEYLEEQGPEALGKLVLGLAEALPFNSGHAGLAFNCDLDLVGVEAEVWEWCRKYPGMDLPRMDRRASQLGTKVSTVSWMTLLGEPVLSASGGAVELREQLRSMGGTVLELSNERVAIVLAPKPEAGGAEHGAVPAAYRRLATTLEPWLFHEQQLAGAEHAEELRRWERRFID
ncbi:type VI immunity family protein [Corallococcus terminator]